VLRKGEQFREKAGEGRVEGEADTYHEKSWEVLRRGRKTWATEKSQKSAGQPSLKCESHGLKVTEVSLRGPKGEG